jgi:hypothetical protein
MEDNERVCEIGRDNCTYCRLDRTPEGHDGCLGTLPGTVINACCGHGGAEGVYIQYSDKPRIADDEAISIMEEYRDSTLPPLTADLTPCYCKFCTAKEK